MKKLYNNYIAIRALLLVMLTSFFAFGASAQTFTSVTFPTSPIYSGEEVTVTYNASGFATGTTFIVWNDLDPDGPLNPGLPNGRLDANEDILGTATTQGSAANIVFTVPGNINSLNLAINGFSGNTQQGETVSFQDADVINAVGYLDQINNGSFDFTEDFSRNSLRQFTTYSLDLITNGPDNVATSEIYTLFVDVDNISGIDADNPVLVYYSLDGFATAGTLLTNTNDDDSLAAGGQFRYVLPDEAKSLNTSFRVQQGGTIDYGTGKAWDTDFMQFIIGDVYQAENNGLVQTQAVTVNQPFIDVQSAVSGATNLDGGTVYTGDAFTVSGEIANATNVSVVATIENSNGDEYILGSDAIDNTTKAFEITGNLPTNVEYDDANDWTINTYPFTGSAPQFGIPATTINLTTGGDDLSDYEVTGAERTGSGLVFDMAGERSLLTPGLNITSQDGELSLDLRRKNDVLTVDGTSVVVEYTTDGNNFTTLVTIDLDTISASTAETISFTDWPAGVVSSSTQFRIRQLTNNGADLDAYIVSEVFIENESNIVDNTTITWAEVNNVNFESPNITLDIIEVGGDGQAFPTEQLNLTYTITNGAFPANTAATVYLEVPPNTGFDSELDLAIGTSTNIASGSIAFTVPSVVEDDYRIYLQTLNDAIYASQTLAIYDLGIDVTTIEISNPITIGDTDFAAPGNDITVNYLLDGTPGTGAQLDLEVRENERNVNGNITGTEFTSIGSTTTFGGSITATLPTSFDYPSGSTQTYRLVISNNNAVDYSTYETIAEFENPLQNTALPDDLIESVVGARKPGTADDSDVFSRAGERSITSVPLDLSNGGRLDIEIDVVSFNSAFDVVVQGSLDGTEWTDLDEFNFTFNTTTQLNDITVPNDLWSEQFQFRVIANEDMSSDDGENSFEFELIRVETPFVADVAESVNYTFDFTRPTVSVNEYSKTGFAIGEEVVINYNATSFPTGTEYAAIVRQGRGTTDEDYVVIGTSSAQGAGSITGTMPVVTPLGDNASGDPYDLEIVPFAPSAAGGMYSEGDRIGFGEDEDYLVFEGTATNDVTQPFNFNQEGDRVVLSEAVDLTSASSATLIFTTSVSYDLMTNKNLIPRLELTTDGGQTFTLPVVEELEEGEEAIYDPGLLYEARTYEVELPVGNAGTHFRISQPLNLAQDNNGANSWTLNSIEVIVDEGNRLRETLYATSANNENSITLSAPDATNYDFMQADLQDAVFNNEAFTANFDRDANLLADEVLSFPSGSTFEFYLNDGSYVIDPETNLPYIIGSASALGNFEAMIPDFVESGNYNVHLAASVMVDGEKYYYIGSEEDGDNVGTLSVFLRAVKTIVEFDAQDVFYAGDEAIFSIDIENDATNAADDANIFSNLVVTNYTGSNQDLVLATAQGITGFTLQLPPYLQGNRTFQIRLSENDPLGQAGDILNRSSLVNLPFDDTFVAGSANTDETFTATNRINDFVGSGAAIEDDLYVSFQYDLSSGASDQRYYFEIYENGVRQDQIQLSDGTNVFQTIDLSTYGIFGNDQIKFEFTSEFGAADGYVLTVDDLDVFDSFDSNPSVDFGLNNRFQNGNISFPNNQGRGLITSRDFTADELSSANVISFDVVINEQPEDLLESQYVIVEYSTDEGSTYTNLDTIPRDIESLPLTSNNTFRLALNDEIRSNGARFRWRQEETASTNVSVANVSFRAAEALNFNYISDQLNINAQQLLATRVDKTEACLADTVFIDFEVRGRMGAENQVQVQYRSAGSGGYSTYPEVFEAFQGTGTVPVVLNNLLNPGDDNTDYEFRLLYTDPTFDSLDFNVPSGNYSAGSNTPTNIAGRTLDQTVEYVAPIPSAATFSVTDPRECEGGDATVTLPAATLQDDFLYEIKDADGNVLGSLEYDDDAVTVPTTIVISGITEVTEIFLDITSRSSSGELTCNTLTSTYSDPNQTVIQPLANFELYGNNGGVNSNYSLVEASDTVTVCNQQQVGILTVNRMLSTGTLSVVGNTSVEWFVNDLNSPVSNTVGNNNLLFSDEVAIAGSYFARVSDGNCVYTTESIYIDLITQPEQPEVTIDGNLSGCDGDTLVTLSAPEGFEFYRWSNGATSRVVDVEDGSYRVIVSNTSFDNSNPFTTTGCWSPASAAVNVERYDLPADFAVSQGNPSGTLVNNTTQLGNAGRLAASEVVEACDVARLVFFEDGLYSNNDYDTYRSIVVFRDGAEFATVTGQNAFYDITESGTYSFEWVHSDENVGCSVAGVEIAVEITETPTEIPELTATGNTTFCQGEGEVVLTAPTGFSVYQWYQDGTAITIAGDDAFDATDNTLTVQEDGFYSVAVGNLNGCLSPVSNRIEVNVRALPPLTDPNTTTPFISQTDANCGTGSVRFLINASTSNPLYTYQLRNAETGETSGNAVQGNNTGGTFITSGEISEPTDFYLEVAYADGAGCANSNPDFTFTGQNNNVVLELEGTTLSALISSFNNAIETRWYRNGIEIRNRRDQGAIAVIDSAEYSVEVDFSGGCTITSNTVTTDNNASVQTFFGDLEVTPFPNPSTDVLNVSLAGGPKGDYDISVMSMSGQIVLRRVVTKTDDEHTETLDVQSLDKGIYNVRIQRGNTVENFRIVKQ